MADRIGPGMIVRWKKDSARRISNGYSATRKHRVLGVRVIQVAESHPRLDVGDRIVIMTDKLAGRREDDRRVWRVHELDVERCP